MTRERTRSRHREKREEPAKPKVVQPGLLGGQYKPLKDEDVRRISEASLELLERVGIEVQPSECRDIFARAGARIDAGRRTSPPSGWRPAIL